MGWTVDVYKIQESKLGSPLERALETFSNAANDLRVISREAVQDAENLTVHIWLSLGLVLPERPPYNALIENEFIDKMRGAVEKIDDASCRPILVCICPDSMFNGAEGKTNALAAQMEEELTKRGILVTCQDTIWRGMHISFGNHYKVLRTQEDSLPGKKTIWAMIEKHLFRQRMLIMCATGPMRMSKLNSTAFNAKHSGIDVAVLQDVASAPRHFKVTSDAKKRGAMHGRQGSTPANEEDQSTGGTVGRNRFTKREKTVWAEAEPVVLDLELYDNPPEYWLKVDMNDDTESLLCLDQTASRRDDIGSKHTLNHTSIVLRTVVSVEMMMMMMMMNYTSGTEKLCWSWQDG